MAPSYATIDEVNSRRAGDVPNVSEAWNVTLEAKIVEKSRALDRLVARARGVAGDFQIVAEATPSSRTFHARDGASWLPVDDCIAIASVTLTPGPGLESQSLVEGTDYVAVRRQGVIVALRRVSGGWPVFPAAIAASARWGLMAEASPDLRELVIVEVIRSYLGDRAGNDDRIGLTPFGAVMTTKAYTALVNRFVADWTYGGGALR